MLKEEITTYKDLAEFIVSEIPAGINVQNNIKQYTGFSWGSYQNIVKNGKIPDINLFKKLRGYMEEKHGLTIKPLKDNKIQIVKKQVFHQSQVEFFTENGSKPVHYKPDNSESINYLVSQLIEKDKQLIEKDGIIKYLQEKLEKYESR